MEGAILAHAGCRRTTDGSRMRSGKLSRLELIRHRSPQVRVPFLGPMRAGVQLRLERSKGAH